MGGSSVEAEDRPRRASITNRSLKRSNTLSCAAQDTGDDVDLCPDILPRGSSQITVGSQHSSSSTLKATSDKHLYVKWLFGLEDAEAALCRQLNLHSGGGSSAFGSLKEMWVKILGKMEVSDGDCSYTALLPDDRIKCSYFSIYEQDEDELSKTFIIRGLSVFNHFLQILLIAISAFSIAISSWAATFREDRNSDAFKLLLWLEFGADLVYVTGLLIAFKTSIVDSANGREICNMRAIRQRTLSSPIFWADVASCFPIVLRLGMVDQPALIFAFRLLRTVRLFDSPPRMKLIYSPLFELARMLLILNLGGHLLGCLWFSVRVVPPEVGRQLSTSLRVGMMCILGVEVGEGAASSGEDWFYAFGMPCGAIMQALVIGMVVSIWQNWTALESAHIQRMDVLRQAMRTLRLPGSVQLRILAFHTFQRLQRNNDVLQTQFQDLSLQLRWEMSLCLYADVLRNTNIFKRMPSNMLRAIMLSFTDHIYLPGDYVCRHGDTSDGMHFILRGQCVVLDPTCMITYGWRKEGEYFGEVSLLTEARRNAYVRAETFCAIAFLSKDDFEDILSDDPDQLEVLISLMDPDQQKALMMEAEANGPGDVKPASPKSPETSSLRERVVRISTESIGSGPAASEDGYRRAAAPPESYHTQLPHAPAEAPPEFVDAQGLPVSASFEGASIAEAGFGASASEVSHVAPLPDTQASPAWGKTISITSAGKSCLKSTSTVSVGAKSVTSSRNPSKEGGADSDGSSSPRRALSSCTSDPALGKHVSKVSMGLVEEIENTDCREEKRSSKSPPPQSGAQSSKLLSVSGAASAGLDSAQAGQKPQRSKADALLAYNSRRAGRVRNTKASAFATSMANHGRRKAEAEKDNDPLSRGFDGDVGKGEPAASSKDLQEVLHAIVKLGFTVDAKLEAQEHRLNTKAEVRNADLRTKLDDVSAQLQDVKSLLEQGLSGRTHSGVCSPASGDAPGPSRTDSGVYRTGVARRSSVAAQDVDGVGSPPSSPRRSSVREEAARLRGVKSPDVPTHVENKRTSIMNAIKNLNRKPEWDAQPGSLESVKRHHSSMDVGRRSSTGTVGVVPSKGPKATVLL